MKNLFVLIITFFVFSNIYSQDKIYFDDAWNETDITSASYYRIQEKLENGLYLVKDFYLNGNLQMKVLVLFLTQSFSKEK